MNMSEYVSKYGCRQEQHKIRRAGIDLGIQLVAKLCLNEIV